MRTETHNSLVVAAGKPTDRAGGWDDDGFPALRRAALILRDCDTESFLLSSVVAALSTPIPVR